MTLSNTRSVFCPVLIGRTPQLVALHQLINAAKGGRGQLGLIAGEAGIGKSRLAAEVTAAAAAQGFLVLEGHCFPADSASSFAPLRDLLRSQFAQHALPLRADDLDPVAWELLHLLPGIVPLPARLDPEGTRLPPLDPEAQKQRLFAALTHYVTRYAAQQPVLLLIEDLHWSDDTSLEFLHQLARRAPAQPLLLLLTYRSDEVSPRLRHWMGQLDRERLAQEVVLPQFSRDEFAAMLQAIFALDRPVWPDLLEMIYTLTEGNPFFIEEVLQALIAAGTLGAGDSGWERKPLPELRIPRSVQDAMQQRVMHLSETARQVLALAAVAGLRFDFSLLQELAHMTERVLIQVIKELIAAQLVVEESAERFAFRHALIRQAIYTELLARERKTLHHQVAETMERLYGDVLDAHLDDLAYHFYAAGAWEQALAYTQRAGLQAQAVFALHPAVEQFSRALDAAHHLGLAPPPHLYRARGQAYATLGEFERGRADYETELALAQVGGDRRAEWQALLDLGVLWAGHDYAQAGEHLQRALSLARDAADPAPLARSLNHLGNWHLNVDQPLEGERYHQEALAIFQTLNDRRGIAETLDLLGIATNMRGDLVHSVAYYQHAVALFRELDDRQALASSLAVLMQGCPTYANDSMVSVRSVAEAIRDGELAVEIARELGWRSGEAYALLALAYCFGPQGEYARAWQAAHAGLTIAEEIEHHEWLAGAHCTLGLLHRDLLASSIAQRHFEQGLAYAQISGSSYWVRYATGLLASSCVAVNDLPRATTLLDAVVSSDTPMQTLGQRTCWYTRAEFAFAHRDAKLALEIADRLIATAPNVSHERVIPRLWHLRAEALVALKRTTEAELVLQAGLEAAAAQGLKPLLWRIYLSLGRHYRARADHAAAGHAFSAAQAIIETLVLNIPDEALRKDFLQQTMAMMPRPRPLPARHVAKQRFAGLTERERDVAAQIAQGKSNRAIAETLVVSESTIATHVRNILGKLGFTSRTQIAAWARDRGLG